MEYYLCKSMLFNNHMQIRTQENERLLYDGYISLIAYGLTSCIDPGYLTAEKARWFRHRRGHISLTNDSVDERAIYAGDQYTTVNSDISSKHNLTLDHSDTPCHSLEAHCNGVESDTATLSNKFTMNFKRDWSNYSCSKMNTDCEVLVNLSVPVRFCKHCLLEVSYYYYYYYFCRVSTLRVFLLIGVFPMKDK
ncbi:unnamed protein product [Trichobilharzia regenti]|nr:unnamed protein product [Trichobilharzia regenti]